MQHKFNAISYSSPTHIQCISQLHSHSCEQRFLFCMVTFQLHFKWFSFHFYFYHFIFSVSLYSPVWYDFHTITTFRYTTGFFFCYSILSIGCTSKRSIVNTFFFRLKKIRERKFERQLFQKNKMKTYVNKAHT